MKSGSTFRTPARCSHCVVPRAERRRSAAYTWIRGGSVGGHFYFYLVLLDDGNFPSVQPITIVGKKCAFPKTWTLAAVSLGAAGSGFSLSALRQSDIVRLC
jgi:hypothetical protein